MQSDKEGQEKFLRKLGAAIALTRKQKGLSGAELARLCDMDAPNLTRIEKGRVNIGVSHLKRICEAMGVSLFELIRATED